MATGVVLVDTNIHTLVLTTDKLHYIDYNAKLKSANEYLKFDRSSITNLTLGKGNLADNMKSAMSFKLQGGGERGDPTKNSDMKKLKFTYEGKSHEFFVYELSGFGKGFKTEKSLSAGGFMGMSKDDLVKTILRTKLASHFFDNVVKINS